MVKSWSFSRMLNCDCDFTERASSGELINTVVYWNKSGECCSQLRYTIWLIYVILFLAFGMAIMLQNYRSKRNFQDKLSNYNERDSSNRDKEHTEYSSVGSIRDPFIN